MTQTTAGAHALHLRHTVSAPRERAFAAFSDPAQLVRWWAGEGFAEPAAEVDLRVGGSYRWSMRADDGELHVATGTFEVIEPPAKLVQTWQWEDEAEVTRLTLLFHERGEATEIELRHEGFAAQITASKHEEGWTACLRRIGATVVADR